MSRKAQKVPAAKPASPVVPSAPAATKDVGPAKQPAVAMDVGPARQQAAAEDVGAARQQGAEDGLTSKAGPARPPWRMGTAGTDAKASAGWRPGLTV